MTDYISRLPMEILSAIAKNLSYISVRNLALTCYHMFRSRFFLIGETKYGPSRNRLEEICKKHLRFYGEVVNNPRLLLSCFPYCMIDTQKHEKYTTHTGAVYYGIMNRRCCDYIHTQTLKEKSSLSYLYIPRILDHILWVSLDKDCEIKLYDDTMKLIKDGMVKGGEKIYMDNGKYPYNMSDYCLLMKESRIDVTVTIKYIFCIEPYLWRT